MSIEIAPGTIVVFSDFGCPWAHLAVHRLHEARSSAGLEAEVSFDMRAFPLELFNAQPTPRRTLDAEIPVAGGLEPDAGWSVWDKDPHTYPVTMLPPMEAVYAAKPQGLGLSDRFDRALRRAFFGSARCISMHHEILDIAAEVDGLDVDRLEKDIIAGAFHKNVFEDKLVAEEFGVKGSPHLYFPDGSNEHNPGIKTRWLGSKTSGFPTVKQDDPDMYQGLLKRAL